MELNIDQLRIVNQKPNGHCLVKGVAGSGKTTVAVSRIAPLINHYLEAGEKILLLTYNKTLIEYTKYLMKDVNLQQNLLFPVEPNQLIDICTIDSIITKYTQKIAPGFRLADKTSQREAMLQAIHSVKKSHEESTVLSEQNLLFLMEEIQWMKSCRYLERETYLNVDRQGRMSVGENRFRLLKNSPTRNDIFDLYITYEDILEKQKLVDFQTNALHLLEALRQGNLELPRYAHVIVDESQDLTRVQLELLHYLYDNSKETNSILFIADAAQSIYIHSWLSTQSFKSVGFDMSGKSNILSKNYRTTYEIATAAYSLMSHDGILNDNDNYVPPTAIERHGSKPVLQSFSSQEEEAAFICNQIKKLSSDFAPKDMVILGASTGYLTHICDYLLDHGIDAEVCQKNKLDFTIDKVKLITLHSIKGLEFPVVFIAGINKGLLPYSEEQIMLGRKLLYVGMTRAKELLYLSHTLEPSVYIQEFDQTLLDTGTSTAAFGNLYRVSLEDYHYCSKIHDKNSREEMVRQWLLKELHQKLFYPYDFMDIEYPVQHYSSPGYVDIVVFDKKRQPFLLAEVKKPGENMERAVKQLQSYMTGISTARYGLVSDGLSTQMFFFHDKGFQDIQELPEYEKPSGKNYHTFTYKSLKNNEFYSCKRNEEDENEVILEDLRSNDIIHDFSFERILRCGSVAAGTLHYVPAQDYRMVLLPDIFGLDEKHHFLLKVSGDSMTDFDIEDGDMIVVQRQPYANVGDIVVAGNKATNEATLKKYYPSSSVVTLAPGNNHYEPIMLRPEDVFINGVVIGIMKDLGVTQA